MEVKNSLENLVTAIKSSKEYQEYWEAKEEVEKDSEKMRNLNKYRTKIYDIQNGGGGDDLYYRIDRIEHESEQFRSDSLIDKFLAAELALCRMVQEINWTLIEELNFDIEFVRED